MGEQTSKMDTKTSFTNLPNYSLEDCAKCVKSFAGTKEEYVGKFIEQIRAVQKMFHVNEIDLKLLIIRKLSGPAEEWFQSKSTHISLTPAELLSELEHVYGNRARLIDLQEVFLQRKWKWREDENFFDYYQEKIKLGTNFNLPEQILVQRIIDGIDNGEWERKANALQIDKTSVLLENMENAIREYKNPEKHQCCSYCKKDNHPSKKCHFKPDPTKEKVLEPCKYCKKTNHASERCFFKNDDVKENAEPCKYCKKTGHISDRCYFKTASNESLTPILLVTPKKQTGTKKKTKSESSVGLISGQLGATSLSGKKKSRGKSESKDKSLKVDFDFGFTEFNFEH